MQPVCPLEGGAVSMGSTCGVVSGGCLGLALSHDGELERGDPLKMDALYGRMREYTRWFERRFGSTVCRERLGADLTSVPGLVVYLFTGRFATRCISHVGPAAEHLVGLCSKPLERSGVPAEGGYCAAPVIRVIREETGLGTELMERVSVALDGGVGLSGGLCGALAGALMAVGSVWGADPRESFLRGTVAPAVEGHVNMYRRRDRPELWSVGGQLASAFRKRFGSMECREITCRSFDSASALSGHVGSSEKCTPVMEWCSARAVEALNAHARAHPESWPQVESAQK